MSEFVLLGSRGPVVGEIGLSRVARDLIALTAWHRLLRRWGLLVSFALAEEPAAEVRACLLVRASGLPAATRLAAGWGRLSGYQVTVLRLSYPGAASGQEGP
jgi:hypothetical protein